MWILPDAIRIFLRSHFERPAVALCQGYIALHLLGWMAKTSKEAALNNQGLNERCQNWPSCTLTHYTSCDSARINP